MQGVAYDVSDHPLGILRATQGVFVQEPFGPGYAQPIETPATTGIAIDIERGANFARFEVSDASH